MHKKIYCYIPQNSLLQREDFSVIHRQASPIKLSEPGYSFKDDSIHHDFQSGNVSHCRHRRKDFRSMVNGII